LPQCTWLARDPGLSEHNAPSQRVRFFSVCGVCIFSWMHFLFEANYA